MQSKKLKTKFMQILCLFSLMSCTELLPFRGRYVLEQSIVSSSKPVSNELHTELQIGWRKVKKTSTDEGGCNHIQEWSDISRSGTLIYVGKLGVVLNEHYSKAKERCIRSIDNEITLFENSKLPLELNLNGDRLSIKMITSEKDPQLNLHEVYVRAPCPVYDLGCWI